MNKQTNPNLFTLALEYILHGSPTKKITVLRRYFL